MKHFAIVIFLFLTVNLFSQYDNDLYCGQDNTSGFSKKVWYNDNQFLFEYLENYPLLDSGHIYFRIPLVLHVYLNPRENEDRLLVDIKRLIQRLNTIYADNKTGIQFYVADIILLNKKKHLKARYYIEAPFITSKKQNKNAINIYYVNVIQKKFLKNTTNYHGTYNSLNNSVIVIRHSSKTTLAHEIGHYLGLKHPHENWKKGKHKQESVSRTRQKGFFSKKTICEVSGDGLSDTPAEPNLAKYTDKDCNYEHEHGLTDAWGEEYNPNTNNIMSYPGNRACRDNFTTMQKSVMLYTAENKKQARYWKTSEENIHFSYDKFEPDDQFVMASEIKIGEKQYHTFHLIPTKNKNKSIENNIDYIYFFNKESNNLSVFFEKAENLFPEIKLTILNSFDKEIQTFRLNSPQKIPLEIGKGKFYLRIENKSIQKKEQLFDYYIEIH